MTDKHSTQVHNAEHGENPSSPQRRAGSSSSSLARRLLQAVGYLSPTSLAKEPDLIAGRWPAYYNMDPMRANLEFARAFQASFKRQFRRSVDRNEAERVQGQALLAITYPHDGRRRGELTAVHEARQLADSYGLPYEPFIDFCMTFAGNRGIVRLPRPNQLVPAKFRPTWEKKLAQHAREFVPVLPQRYQNEMVGGVSGKPGCFGVPGASGSGEACRTCDHFQQCTTLAEKVMQKAAEISQESGRPATYRDKAEALRLERNLRKAARQRDVRAGRVTPLPRSKKPKVEDGQNRATAAAAE